MHIRPHGNYIDATFGRGGHSHAILEQLGSGGALLVVDQDPSAISEAGVLAAADARVSCVHARFSALGEIVAERDWVARTDGILFDLGMSSPQLDDAERGFSFREDGPLDMRMDPARSFSAAEWLAQAGEREISDVLWRLGEERASRHIAKRIVKARAKVRLSTTLQLADLVRRAIPGRRGKIDPATRTFQALRMHVNDELGELERAIEYALGALAVGGRLLIIAFHSLEDRIVKRRFKTLELENRQQPMNPAPRFHLVMKKPIMANEQERKINPRARSARLRVLERVA